MYYLKKKYSKARLEAASPLGTCDPKAATTGAAANKLKIGVSAALTIYHDNSEEGYDKGKYLNYAYETACAQHEIDHLDGITMFERKRPSSTIKREGKNLV